MTIVVMQSKNIYMKTYPAGVDDDDVEDVDESRHLGVVALAGGWQLLLAGLLVLVVASVELFSEGLADEGAPRYLIGKTCFRLVSL